MADIFVNSNAVGLNDGSTWVDAYATFGLAVTASLSSDRIIMAVGHQDTITANTTYILTGDNYIISSTVSGTNTVTYVKATSPQVTAGSGNLSIELRGNNSFFYGVWIQSGNLLKTPNCLFYECTLKSGAGGANPGASSIGPATAGSSAEYNYCDLENGSTNSFDGVISVGNRTVVEVTGGTLTSLRTATNANHAAFELSLDASIDVNGVDCSGFQVDNFLLVNPTARARTKITRCRLNAATTTLSTLTNPPIGCDIIIEACDSSNTVTRKYRANLQGELFSDSVIKLTDANFIYSNKITTNASALEFFNPVRFPVAVDFADFATTKTINIEIVQDGAIVGLKDTELWFEVLYPNDTNSSYLVDSSRAANNQSGATITTSTESYDGLSATSVKQKVLLSTTSTGKEGSFQVYACLSKPSTTVYVTVKSIS